MRLLIIAIISIIVMIGFAVAWAFATWVTIGVIL
jgi:hypothetical protein